MPLVHRRTIVKTEITDQWIDHHTGEYFIRYTATWDDGLTETFEGRIPIVNKHRVGNGYQRTEGE
jgi:hypothetical protein